MKITNSTVNKAYKTTLKIKEELSAKKQDSVFENTDVVSMSQQAKNANFASKVSKNICEDVESGYSAAKLNALKNQKAPAHIAALRGKTIEEIRG